MKKKILRITINLILLLSLTGCDTSCSIEEYKVLVTNQTQTTISARIEGANTEVGGETGTIPPGGAQYFVVNERVYAATVWSQGKWLAYATAKADELTDTLKEMNFDEQVNHVPVNQAEVDKLGAELGDIQAQIKAYKFKTTVHHCRSFVTTDGQGVVIVNDGTSPDSIEVNCMDPKS